VVSPGTAVTVCVVVAVTVVCWPGTVTVTVDVFVTVTGGRRVGMPDTVTVTVLVGGAVVGVGVGVGVGVRVGVALGVPEGDGDVGVWGCVTVGTVTTTGGVGVMLLTRVVRLGGSSFCPAGAFPCSESAKIRNNPVSTTATITAAVTWR